MTTPNEQLAEDFINRAIDVFGMTEVEARIVARDFSDKEDQRAFAELMALFLADGDPYQRSRAIDRILAQRVDALERVKDRMYRLLERFAEDEGEYVSETVGPVQDETQESQVFTAAFIAVLINRVMQTPINRDNGKFDDIFKELIVRDRGRLEQTLSRAFGLGVGTRGVPWLTKHLRADFEDTAQSIHIVLHGMVQHTRSVVVDLAMASVGGSVRWVSVLDGKTTAICRARSGKIYPAGSGPRPPAHVRCRSIVVPYFKGKGEYEEPTYSDWLKRQTPERVREILGKTKGDMFLRGELSLEDMVTAKGRELTLKELAAKRKSRT